ncbi:MAG TPA: siderophore-interacting protein [Ramlibacter sp.]|jgi:NADPH-dependent ferric siderophore reductase|uniref:siderophore-interacting protein n=1 Tax=Ramlibacter sp. TaxID=1917967 RepID=UPI002D48C492|nr:siderophore-interacting protein [Ramlibacter sp.]HZY18317.1 siderophore-interacting protein [Ramlibacter sp.]
MNAETPARRVVRVRHELRRRDVEVADVSQPSPGFVAVTFAGDALADFVSESFDDHVKFLIDDGSGGVVGRDYTPRRFSREQRRLTIEFAMHGDGPADRWARQARVGQRVTIGGPRGSMIIPSDYDWHLLVGDTSALPAIARRLEELPAGARAHVLVQADEADRRMFASRADVTLGWVNTGDDLLAALATLPLPAGEGFAWAAGEASIMGRLRQLLLEEKRHPKQAMRVAAYWKRGAVAHHQNLDD